MKPLSAAVAFALVLTGCEQASTQLDAAQDIRAFLVAVKARDRAAFDAHVDRGALKVDLQRQLAERAGRGDPAASFLQSRLGEQVLDRLIAPETFQFALQSAGPIAQRLPSAPEIAAILKPAGEGRVCLPQGGRDGPCVVTFARQGEDWRLVGISADGLQVQSLPFPPSAAG